MIFDSLYCVIDSCSNVVREKGQSLSAKVKTTKGYINALQIYDIIFNLHYFENKPFCFRVNDNQPQVSDTCG